MEFKSLSELYQRINPALISKVNELNRVGINYIKEQDIWNFLKETKWVRTSDLSLSDMVNDIFKLREEDIDKYVKDNMNNIPRVVNLESDE